MPSATFNPILAQTKIYDAQGNLTRPWSEFFASLVRNQREILAKLDDLRTLIPARLRGGAASSSGSSNQGLDDLLALIWTATEQTSILEEAFPGFAHTPEFDTITPDASILVHRVTLGSALTIANPTNVQDGLPIILVVQQGSVAAWPNPTFSGGWLGTSGLEICRDLNTRSIYVFVGNSDGTATLVYFATGLE